MYERFTDRARKVMQLANQEAQRLNHQYIRTEHILLGLVKEGSGVAADVLKDLNVSLDKVRHVIVKVIPYAPTQTPVPGRLPHTPKARKVLEHALEEADTLNHKYVGTEHLLLGLMRVQEGVAADVLINLGLSLEEVRAEVLNHLGSKPPEHLDDFEVPEELEQPPEPLSGHELQQIRAYIQQLHEERETAVMAQDFERAARCNERLVPPEKLLAWYEWYWGQE
jgi:ATP-dependent Clp protease ATP-binding subunit ClpC